jgi:toxin CcdB
MAQYGLFRNPEGEGYLLDVQTDLLDGLNTRVVVPLLPKEQAPSPAQRLNPTFEIEGASFVMMTQYLSAVPASLLDAPAGSLEAQFDKITAALDMLFHGF